MTIQERLAWVHAAATSLSSTDLVEVKHSLKNLIAEATEALEVVRGELQEQRRQRGKSDD